MSNDALRALQATEYELKRAKLEVVALRRLCKEAADLYAQGGTFPIKGEMSMNLLHASNGHLAAPHHTGTLRAALTPPAGGTLAERCAAAEAELAAYKTALDPNETKAAYIGEFACDQDCAGKHSVSWPVTKAIMRAISDRAAQLLKDTP